MPARPISPHRVAYDERAKAARQVVTDHREFLHLRRVKQRLLDAAKPHVQALTALDGARGDLTPAAYERRRQELRAALKAAVDGAFSTWAIDAAEFRGKFRRLPPQYPVKPDDAARVTMLGTILAQVTPAEATERVQALLDAGDLVALQNLLPVVRSKLETAGKLDAAGYLRGKDGTITPRDRALYPLAAVVEDMELALVDTGALTGQHADAAVAALAPQVEVMTRTLVEEGKWEGTLAARVVATVADRETPNANPMFAHAQRERVGLAPDLLADGDPA